MENPAFNCRNVLDCFQDLPEQAIRAEYCKNAQPEKICCLNLTGDPNIAMIVRSASLFGLSEVVILGRRPYHRRATVGMHNYVPTNFYRAAKGPHSEEYDLPAILTFLKQMSASHTIVFVEQGGAELKNAFSAIDKPALFVMGNEGNGIPDQILAFQPSMRVSIPQRGVGRSHNVANAASIVLWEYFRELM